MRRASGCTQGVKTTQPGSGTSGQCPTGHTTSPISQRWHVIAWSSQQLKNIEIQLTDQTLYLIGQEVYSAKEYFKWMLLSTVCFSIQIRWVWQATFLVWPSLQPTSLSSCDYLYSQSHFFVSGGVVCGRSKWSYSYLGLENGQKWTAGQPCHPFSTTVPGMMCTVHGCSCGTCCLLSCLADPTAWGSHSIHQYRFRGHLYGSCQQQGTVCTHYTDTVGDLGWNSCNTKELHTVFISYQGNCFIWTLTGGQGEKPTQLHPKTKIPAHKRYALKCHFSPDSTLV